MNDASQKTTLVTGANSGIGFEAAALLAEAGWGKVTLACPPPLAPRLPKRYPPPPLTLSLSKGPPSALVLSALRTPMLRSDRSS